MDTWFFRAGLLLYVAIAVLMTFQLWRSPGGENTWTQLVTLLGSLALALVAVIPSLKQDYKHSFIFPVLFRDTEHGTLLAGNWGEPYFKGMGDAFSRLNIQHGATGVEVAVAEEDEVAFLEYVIIETLMGVFRGAWNGNYIEHSTVFGMGASGTTILGDVGPNDIRNQADVKSALATNKFISTKGLTYDSFVMPAGTKLEILNQGKLGSRISMKANGFEIGIVIAGINGGGINSDVWGLLRLEDSNNQAKYAMNRYTIIVEGVTDKMNRYPPNIGEYWKWYGNVVNCLRRIDWSTIDAKILEQENRKNLWHGKDFYQRMEEYAKRLRDAQGK